MTLPQMRCLCLASSTTSVGVAISTGSGAETQMFTVDEPDLVWAIQDEHGELVAVEIVARDSRNLILRLEP